MIEKFSNNPEPAREEKRLPQLKEEEKILREEVEEIWKNMKAFDKKSKEYLGQIGQLESVKEAARKIQDEISALENRAELRREEDNREEKAA